MSSDTPKIGAIVQARLGSTRLPGKVLIPVAGKPLLQYVLESLRRVTRLCDVVVATSTSTEDDPIALWCEYAGVTCHRGDLADVVDRFCDVLSAFALDAFVRISADSPLLDHRLVERGIRLYEGSHCDLATNVFPRTFPTGQSIEIVRSRTFLETCRRIVEADDREHVTTFFYRHASEFRIENFARDPACRACEFAVDTPQHLTEFEAIVAAMTRPHWEYNVDELIRLHATVCGGDVGCGSGNAGARRDSVAHGNNGEVKP